jgi:N-acyl-D-amino-acid deacylase
MQVGKVADITIFDPQTITDNSGYKVGEHGTPTTGIPYVIVSGTIVVKDNAVLPVKAGEAIRFPVEAQGRFEEIEVNKWLNEHTIGVNPDLVTIDVHDDSGAGALLDGSD